MTNPLPLVMTPADNSARRSAWLFSWPLIVGALVFLYSLSQGKHLLNDGDTYWHVATGRWILEHGTVPRQDPFSHTVRGAMWTAHEWLSEIILATAHDLGGWTAVVAVTAFAFAVTIALLTRSMLRTVEPIYALLFAVFGVFMTAGHLLARPHILAMPWMMIWTIGLVRASEAGRAPTLWLLPVITIWANIHGGFTLGLGLAFAFALEALWQARQKQRLGLALRSWALFLVLALACSLLTPHGPEGILFTWSIFVDSSYALENIGEWQSPSFHQFQPLEIWLMAGLAMFLHQGIRLPLFRLLLLLGLLHLALKHARNVELLGLLAPLFLATTVATHLRQRRAGNRQMDRVDRVFNELARPAGSAAVAIALVVSLLLILWAVHTQIVQPPESTVPATALHAAQKAQVKGNVLNEYVWGGYLIYSRIPVFIDGRADMYKEKFFKEYIEALNLKETKGLENLLQKYDIEWTFLHAESPAVTLLDHLPQWRRLYADKTAVVHVRDQAAINSKTRTSNSHQPSGPV